ncbi:MAG: DUF4956 domain-containing protein [Calditrichia bacterium]
MFNDAVNLLTPEITFPQVIFNLLIALFSGLIISIFYRITYRGPNYSSNYVRSLIILSSITAVVIMVIGNNLARAFGLVGAMSIIRFRTAIKDTQDIVFIFFALAVGMAAGVGLHSVSIVSALLIGFITLILQHLDYGNPHKQDIVLQVLVDEQEYNAGELEDILKNYCRSFKLINIKTLSDNHLLELTYYIKLKNGNKKTDLIQALNEKAALKHINLFYDEEQF